MSIDFRLEMAEQPRRILHFVDYDRRGVALEKALRLFFSLFRFGGEVEGDEGVVGKEVAECGGFSGLVCAGEDKDGARLCRVL